MIKYIIKYVMENCPEEMNFFNSFIDKGLFDKLNNVINSDFVRISYTDAIKELEKNNDNFEFPVHWGSDLQTEHERYLCEVLFKKPVFVTDYPAEIKAFYMKLNPDRNRIVAGLGMGVLVVEAKEKSGTGITAEYAKQFNRKVFCIPHRIGDDAGVGTNRLIKRGAMLVTEAQDLLPFFENIKSIKKKEVTLQVEIPEEYKKVYDSLQEPLNADEVSKKTKMKIVEVNTILTMLELEGYIESMPGNFFRRK